MDPLSLRAYARHRGVRLSAVQKAIKSGRIAVLEDGRVDPTAADADWTRKTGPRPPRPRMATTSSASGHRAVVRAPAPDLSDPPRLETGVEYHRARAVRENYMARLAKIEFEERTGKVVNRDEVQVAAFNRFRAFRDGMLNIPDRLAAVLAAEGDAARVHELLTTEIRKALLEFADDNG